MKRLDDNEEGEMGKDPNSVYDLGPTCARTDTLTPSSYCCH